MGARPTLGRGGGRAARRRAKGARQLIRQDVRDAWRGLRRQPLVTATIVLTLGLGLGANTAVFSLLNAVVLRTSLPVPDTGQLFTVNGGRFVSSGPESARLSGPMFDRLRQTAPPGARSRP